MSFAKSKGRLNAHGIGKRPEQKNKERKGYLRMGTKPVANCVSLNRFLVVESDGCFVHCKAMHDITCNCSRTGSGECKSRETRRACWYGCRSTEIVYTTVRLVAMRSDLKWKTKDYLL
jgi:hypothetical protein